MRGYSGNKGKPTEKNIYIDAESSIDWLIKKKNITRKNIIIYGESLGTGAAVQLATKKNFKSIAIVKIPNFGIGRAINDRLLKASKK